MEDTKGKYTFVDKRGQSDAPSQPERPQEELKVREEAHAARPGFEPGEFPPIDFSTLIMSFASSAVMAMGKAPDPHTGQVFTDLAMAKQNIDIILLLQQKTKGNRTKEEDQLLEGILYDLRMLFVEVQGGKK